MSAPPDYLPGSEGLGSLAAALGAPGSPAELADGAAAVQRYRSSAVARRSRLRSRPRARRFHFSAAAVSAALGGACVAGGVGVAYGSVLPPTVQRAAHVVLGPVGVPDARPRPGSLQATSAAEARAAKGLHHSAAGSAESAGSKLIPLSPSEAAGHGQPAGSNGPAGSGGHGASGSGTAGSGGSGSGPSGSGTLGSGTSSSGTPGSGATPSAGSGGVAGGTSPGPVPTLALSASSLKVELGSGLTIRGQLGAIGGRRPSGVIRAYARTAARPGWAQIGRANVGAGGIVTFDVSVDVTTQFVLRGPLGSKSSLINVKVVDPVGLTVLSAGSVGSGPTIAVSAAGAQVGDQVELFRLEQGQWVAVETGTLGDGGGAALMPGPYPSGTAERFQVVLSATTSHAASTSATIEVGPT